MSVSENVALSKSFKKESYMRSFLINKTIMSATSQNQINLTIPSGQPSETQNHIEKIFPKSAITICSFLQLFCAFTAYLVQVKNKNQPYFLAFLQPLVFQIFLWSLSYNRGSENRVELYCFIFFGAAGGIGLLTVHRPSHCT